MPEEQQHDDHCWFTWNGDFYRVTRISEDFFYLEDGTAWTVISWPRKNWPIYAEKAARIIKEVFKL